MAYQNKKEANPNRIGSLYNKVSQKTGKEYMGGTLHLDVLGPEFAGVKLQVNIFANDFPKDAESPQFVVYRVEPQAAGAAPAAKPAFKKAVPATAARPAFAPRPAAAPVRRPAVVVQEEVEEAPPETAEEDPQF